MSILNEILHTTAKILTKKNEVLDMCLCLFMCIARNFEHCHSEKCRIALKIYFVEQIFVRKRSINSWRMVKLHSFFMCASQLCHNRVHFLWPRYKIQSLNEILFPINIVKACMNNWKSLAILKLMFKVICAYIAITTQLQNFKLSTKYLQVGDWQYIP